MNDHPNVELVPPQLSKVRTLLFGALAITWFVEMVSLGFPAFSRVWTYLWQVLFPQNPRLAAALDITWAIAAPAKGALFVLAIFGLRSRSPSTRTALFASMALVPPLNIAFPFRQQGFLLEPVAVATILSAVLWGSFFLFREHEQLPKQKRQRGSGQLAPSRWEVFQYVWFAVYSTVLTLSALLFLFWPKTALTLVLPCISSLMSADPDGLSSLIHTVLASGTHLLALAVATWTATVHIRSNPALRQAVTIASMVHAGLFLVFPLRLILLEFGGECAASSILAAFVPLFVCWVAYIIVDTMKRRRTVNSGPRSGLPTSSQEGMI